jgi:hypothetical protein
VTARTYLSARFMYMYILYNLIWMGSIHKLLETMVQVMVYNIEGWKLNLPMVMSFIVPRWHGRHIWSPATPTASCHNSGVLSLSNAVVSPG